MAPNCSRHLRGLTWLLARIPCALSACGRLRTPLATAVGGSAFGLALRPRPGKRWRLPVRSLLRAPALRRNRLVRLPAAEDGGWRTRGRSGSSAASVVSLAETRCAEGSGSSRRIDLRSAAATTPRRTARAPPADRSRYAKKCRRAKLTGCVTAIFAAPNYGIILACFSDKEEAMSVLIDLSNTRSAKPRRKMI